VPHPFTHLHLVKGAGFDSPGTPIFRRWRLQFILSLDGPPRIAALNPERRNAEHFDQLNLPKT
jgi:hypothetical protein